MTENRSYRARSKWLFVHRVVVALVVKHRHVESTRRSATSCARRRFRLALALALLALGRRFGDGPARFGEHRGRWRWRIDKATIAIGLLRTAFTAARHRP
jgi:hypothetical protein